ncbi:MAG: precorrin-6A/cobalt-precorrin-6A reductase, partial [Alistipes sp.]|nr:precorrin-6A/cobalt-precorrin-6A reductase [Alistipes sp.]
MILVLGGTTEGRAAARVVESGDRAWLYSTLTASQEDLATPLMERLTGPLTADGATALCRERGVRLIVDAAHPFAEGAHLTAQAAAAECGIPLIRYSRPPAPEDDSVTWCDDCDDAVRRLEAAGVRRLLALTGVRTIPRLRAFWERHECRFRVLDRPESVAEAVEHGFPRDGLLFYRPGEPEIEVMRRELPDVEGVPTAVLTKESGAAGGFPEKVAAARALGIPVFAIRRPALPEDTHTVYTEWGLRRRIDELLPGWFALRSGYTTGTCATAAACAALRGVIDGEELREVAIALPGGERVVLPVERMSIEGGAARTTASATVVKDAGDDPDVT